MLICTTRGADQLVRASFLLNAEEPPQCPQAPPPPPLTPDDRHELSLLAIGPPHEEELFNRSGIFKTYVEDSVENEASNPTFAVFFEGHVTWFGTPLRLRLITVGGVAYARQGDLDTYCLVFLSESVVWTHLGYFLGDGTTFALES
ncbi:hypothetical protein GmHk_03G007282 [Glycine max]|nr:hypothetical protein GmHk_03G007282 [Glycine max]